MDVPEYKKPSEDYLKKKNSKSLEDDIEKCEIINGNIVITVTVKGVPKIKTIIHRNDAYKEFYY